MVQREESCMRKLVTATGEILTMLRTPAQFSLSSPDSSVAIRILAGCTTGAMAVTCAQPTDVVKVRFQAMIRLGTGGERKYKGTMDAYRTIAREEGIRGLWKGKCGTLWQSFPSLRAETGNPARRNSQSMALPKNTQIHYLTHLPQDVKYCSPYQSSPV